jgi:hypothetical protein
MYIIPQKEKTGFRGILAQPNSMLFALQGEFEWRHPPHPPNTSCLPKAETETWPNFLEVRQPAGSRHRLLSRLQRKVFPLSTVITAKAIDVSGRRDSRMKKCIMHTYGLASWILFGARDWTPDQVSKGRSIWRQSTTFNPLHFSALNPLQLLSSHNPGQS